MKKTSKLIIIIGTAALTFGSLVAFVGPKDWHHHGHHRWGHHHYDHHHHDGDQVDKEKI